MTLEVRLFLSLYQNNTASVNIPGKLIILMIISTDTTVFSFQRASLRSQRKNLNRKKRFNLKLKREELQMMSKP